VAEGLFLAYTHPRSADSDAEMNRWYSQHHLPEILTIPGVMSASRYRSLDPQPDYGYLATYTLSGGDLRAIVNRIFAEGPRRTATEASRTQPPTSFALYEFIESQRRQ
jgi:hypothetical protein